GTKETTAGAHLVSMAVNNPSRVHFGMNKRACAATRPEYDVLFRSGKDFERYDPERHGRWEIAKAADGKFKVRLVEEGTGGDPLGLAPEPDVEAVGTSTTFAAESHLRDYLAKHLDQVEVGLTLHQGPDGDVGIEFSTAIGVIDLLAIDKSGGFVVIELKVGKSPDSVVGQVLRYRTWVRKHLAKEAAVRAVIVAEAVTDKIRYAIDGLDGIDLLEYEIQFLVRRVPELEKQLG
ncbi:MAG: endonuclease NucS domain-containing protein, partial [Candidatus Dormibacteria bacterium]